MISLWFFVVFMIIFILLVLLINIYVATKFINYWTEKLIKMSDEHYDTKVGILINSVEDIREKVEVLGTPYSKGMIAGMDAIVEQVKLMESVK